MARILIVEDRTVVAWNLQETLESLDHEVIACTGSGESALAIALQDRPDLILMDIWLSSDVDGVDAATEIQTQIDVPIIYLTAHNDQETLQRALATHPYGYLLKPVSAAELHTAVEMALHRYQLEQQLAATQQWLATMLNSIGDGTIAVDRTGRIIFMNPAAETLTGWSQRDVIGRPIDDVLVLQDGTTHQPVSNPLIRALETRSQVSLPDNCVLQTKTGQQRFIGNSATPIQSSDGSIMGSILVFQDITSRKQAEIALQHQMELNQRVANISTRFINLESQEIFAAIDQALQEIGEFIQVDTSFVFRSRADGAAFSMAHEWVTNGHTSRKAQTQNLPVQAFPWVIDQLRQGSVIKVEDIDHLPDVAATDQTHWRQFGIRSIMLVPLTYQGHIFGFTGFASFHATHDWNDTIVNLLRIVGEIITNALQRQQAETQLREREERFRSIFKQSAVGMNRVNALGQYIEVNPAFCQLVGYSEAELLTMRFQDLTHPDDVDLDTEFTRQMFAGETSSYELEKRFLCKDGSVCWTYMTVTRVDDLDVQPRFTAAIVQDISDRKQAERHVEESRGRLQLQQAVIMQLSKLPDLYAGNVDTAIQRLTAAAAHTLDIEFVSVWFFDEVRDALCEADEYILAQRRHRAGAALRCADYPRYFHTIETRSIVVADDALTHPDVAELSRDWISARGIVSMLDIPIRAFGKTVGILCSHCATPRDWLLEEQNFLSHVAHLISLTLEARQRRQLEEALRTTEEQLRQIVDNIHDVFFLKEIHTGRLIYVNKAYEELYQHSREELYQHPEIWLNSIHPDDRDRVAAHLRQETQGEVFADLEYRIVCPDGTVRWMWDRSFPICNEAGQIYRYAGVNRDITERKQTEAALRRSEELFRQFAEHSQDVLWIFDPIQRQELYVSPAYEQIWGRSCESLYQDYTSFIEAIHPEDRPRVQTALQQAQTRNLYQAEYRVVHPDGTIRWVFDRGFLIRNQEGIFYRFAGIAQDITDRKAFETSLRQQTEREQILSAISQRIRCSLNLDEILSITVTEIRQVLRADRVVVCSVAPGGICTVIAESVTADWLAMAGDTIVDPCLDTDQNVVPDKLERISSIADIYTDNISPCHLNLLEQYQVRANMVVSISEHDQFWGLLAVHQCSGPRQWQPWELELLNHLSDQLSLAIQQARLYRQVQQLNANLEDQVEERTAQLRQAFQFEATLKRITDKVRDSLDEAQILQTAVQELATALEADRCNAGLFDPLYQTSTIASEYVRLPSIPSRQGQVVNMAQDRQLYDQLQQGQGIHCCALPSPSRSDQRRFATLVYPLKADQHILGDLWLYRSAQQWFSCSEMRLVEQVANQCAIAVRQARLYEAAQTQVQELERLNRLKDDFLSTVSHELRTPMSSIQMATQMLEVVIGREASFQSEEHPIHRYLKILRHECHRETELINNLLDLSRLDAHTEPLCLSGMNLYHWLPHFCETFCEPLQQQRLLLELDIPADLPLLTTDFSCLERILRELLQNACKYTPPRETVTIAVQSRPPFLQIQVCNSGVEIPPQECDRVFDKFYRIPNSDPWKYGGTGLGLALVKKLVEHLSGSISLASKNNQVTFTIVLPITLSVDDEAKT